MAGDDRAELGSPAGHRPRVATSTGRPFYRVVAFVPIVHNSGDLPWGLAVPGGK